MPLLKIVSGGQTGADRGALDAALAAGAPAGGWCPRGRRAEDGMIPEKYPLRETASDRYEERTLANVRDSDATLLVTRGAPAGGSRLTAELARSHGRPLVHVDLEREPIDAAIERVRAWLSSARVACLNVAGPRESEAPGIRDQVYRLVRALLEPRRA